MKKNKLLRRISVGVAALALICTSAVATSFAKYQTTHTGTDSVAIAKWEFTVNKDATGTKGDENDTFVLDLAPYNYLNVAKETAGGSTSKLAPGTEGQFQIVALNSSEVDASYTISFIVTDKPANLNFYYDSAATSTITADSTYTETGTKYNYDFTADGNTDNDGALPMTATQETVTVYWKWTDSTTPESDQSTIATGTKSMKVVVTVQGTQDTVRKVS